MRPRLALVAAKRTKRPAFRVQMPGLGAGQRDEVPGFRVGQPDEVPGFRMNADGTVRRRSPGGSAARHLLDDLNAMRETIPVKCTSDGTTFGCTTPRGKTFSNVPAPPNFPARIQPGVPNYPQWLQKQLSEGTWAPISKESLTDPSRNRSDKALIGRLGRPRPVRARLRP